MTTRRQSKRESVKQKSLKLQEKLAERAKKKGVANPNKSGPSVDKTPAVEDNSNLTSNINIDPNPADTDSSEHTSDEEVMLITFQDIEEKLVNPTEQKWMKQNSTLDLEKLKPLNLLSNKVLQDLTAGQCQMQP